MIQYDMDKSTVKSRTKIENVYESLHRRIQSLSPGERVSSVRDLMREFRVSQATVDRAMEMLDSRGLIVRRAGKGTYVADVRQGKMKRRKRCIAFAVPDYPSFLFELMISPLNEVLKRKHAALRMVRYREADRVPRIFPRDRIDAMIILMTGSRIEPADICRLKDFDIPVVVLDRIIPNIAIDCVGTNNHLGGALAAEHLLQLGHRRLAVLLAEPHTVSSETRVAAFRDRIYMDANAQCRVLDCHTKPGELAAEKAHQQIDLLYRRDDLDFTGLFVISDSTALGAVKALHDHGVGIPSEVSVVGFDDIPESRFFYPALTTIRQDIPRIVDEAMDIIDRRLDGEDSEMIQYPVSPKLIVRESTASLANEAARHFSEIGDD